MNLINLGICLNDCLTSCDYQTDKLAELSESFRSSRAKKFCHFYKASCSFSTQTWQHHRPTLIGSTQATGTDLVMQVSSQCYQSNRNSVTHQCPRLPLNTPCFVSENKGYGRPLHRGKWTTPLKQTVLAALWNGSIMLGLCPFQSSTLVLLLHNRCHLRLLFSFIVSSIPKAHLLFYICPPR